MWAMSFSRISQRKSNACEASAEKILRHKPDAAVDGCWNGPDEFIAERQSFDRLPSTRCNQLFPSYAFPRFIAGGPLAADVIKCRLKP
jgi:hypothetical protein